MYTAAAAAFSSGGYMSYPYAKSGMRHAAAAIHKDADETEVEPPIRCRAEQLPASEGDGAQGGA